jgi:serine/threonine protein kinase
VPGLQGDTVLAPLTEFDPPTIGPFRLGGRLGAGGMGVVFLGFGPDDRPVAVKMPAPELARDPRFRARFRREVAAAQMISSNSVASVVAADTEAPVPWLATEYIQGATVLDAVQARGPLAQRLVVGFAAGLADGLVAMHAVGVVHRDLKPANVVLAWDGPKIIDFGVALTMGPALGGPSVGGDVDLDITQARTHDGQRLGTFVWMAPEQLLGEQVGPPADVFAWGCCVTYATTGHSPFRALSAPETIARIQRDAPDLDGVPAQLVDLVSATLAKDPAVRPPATMLVSRLVHRQVRTPLESDRAVETALLPWVAQPPTPPPLRVSPPRPVGDRGAPGPRRGTPPPPRGGDTRPGGPWTDETRLPGGGGVPRAVGPRPPLGVPPGPAERFTAELEPEPTGRTRPSTPTLAALVALAGLVVAGAAILGVLLTPGGGHAGTGSGASVTGVAAVTTLPSTLATSPPVAQTASGPAVVPRTTVAPGATTNPPVAATTAPRAVPTTQATPSPATTPPVTSSPPTATATDTPTSTPAQASPSASAAQDSPTASPPAPATS